MKVRLLFLFVCLAWNGWAESFTPYSRDSLKKGIGSLLSVFIIILMWHRESRKRFPGEQRISGGSLSGQQWQIDQINPFLSIIRWITCMIVTMIKRNRDFIISTIVTSRISVLKTVPLTNRFYMPHTIGRVEKHSLSTERTHSTPIRKRIFLSE